MTNLAELQAFVRTILDDPDEAVARLVFADWLQEHGQEARAEWIRASCEIATLRPSDSRSAELRAIIQEKALVCTPKWWTSILSVEQRNHRGMYRFVPFQIHRGADSLGRTEWLSEAFSEGWIERVEINDLNYPAPTSEVWNERLREIPLFLGTHHPSYFSAFALDRPIGSWLEFPQIVSIQLPPQYRFGACWERIIQRTDLKELGFSLQTETRSRCAELLDGISRLTNLQQLTIEATPRTASGPRPNDQDLLRLAPLRSLKRLYLPNCHAITPPGLFQLRERLPSLSIATERPRVTTVLFTP